MKRRSPRSFDSCYIPGDSALCWQWTGFLTRDGYGQHNGRKAHRVLYERLVGPIPLDFDLDHLCRNRGCVNPAHLEPVTRAENIRRGSAPSIVGVSRPTCRNGHPRSPENVYVAPNTNGRICRACNREAASRLKARRRQAFVAGEGR